MRVKLCDRCPYTLLDLADHYDPEAALHLCRSCDSAPGTCRKQGALAELGERFSTLTSRERQIMGLLSEGHKLKGIAEGLGVSTHTIRVHRGRIMSKMDAQSVPDLVRMSDELGKQSITTSSTQCIRKGTRITFHPQSWRQSLLTILGCNDAAGSNVRIVNPEGTVVDEGKIPSTPPDIETAILTPALRE